MPRIWWGVVALATLTFCAGLFVPPNNYDSLTYHLARTTYWMQHADINFYATAIQRQLYQPPLSEYFMLHIRMLTGSDRFAFMVQWSAYLGCLVGIYHIARRLHANPVFAVVFVATIPMAILQASSTQNDLILAFWLVCVVWFIIDHQPLYVGIATGLAILTKGTAYIYLPPFLVWFAVNMMSHRRWKALLGAGLIAATINAPHWVRNVLEYEAPIAYGKEIYANENLSLIAFASSVIRNVSLHLPIDGHAITLGLGLDPSDPRITFNGEIFPFQPFRSHEDVAGAFFHVLLISATLVFALRKPSTRTLMLCVSLAFVLFCLYLKWQVWHGRQHLSLLVLAAPCVALCIPVQWQRRIMPMMIAIGIIVAMMNEMRPIWNWAFPPNETPTDYLEFASQVRTQNCDMVLLKIGANDPEYLLHRLLPDVAFSHEATEATCAVFTQASP